MKYLVSGRITVSAYTEVDAGSPEEAMKIAASRGVSDLHIDGGWPVDECWHIDSDGTPSIEYVEGKQ